MLQDEVLFVFEDLSRFCSTADFIVWKKAQCAVGSFSKLQHYVVNAVALKYERNCND